MFVALTPAGILYPDSTISLVEVLIFPGATGWSLQKKLSINTCSKCSGWRSLWNWRWVWGHCFVLTCAFPWLPLSGRTFCRCVTPWPAGSPPGRLWFPGTVFPGFLGVSRVSTGRTTGGDWSVQRARAISSCAFHVHFTSIQSFTVWKNFTAIGWSTTEL